MSRLPAPLDRLPFPVIGAPLFIISNPRLVIAQCIAGVVGSMPALNARPPEQLEEWLLEITQALAAYNLANPQAPAAPFAINQIVHKSNGRLEHDMRLCVKYKVPIIITSLGAREDVNAAVHSYGGVVLHDVIHNKHAHKAIEKGADGLIAVATGLLSTTSAMASHATAESLLIFVCLSKFAQALADTVGGRKSNLLSPSRPGFQGFTMRAIFSILSLLIVLIIVGLLAKKQWPAQSSAPITAPADFGVLMPTTTPSATPQQQSLQIQQQVKESLDAAIQQARPVPDDK